MRTFSIKNSVLIRNSKVYKNGELAFENGEDPELAEFLKTFYKVQNLRYPKFFKMDNLSKLGLLGIEILTGGIIEDKQTALVFGNSASSLDTDKAFTRTINEYPSPALFVYTLPNIMLGEISIRHKLRSENIFFIAENFDSSLFLDYSNSLIQHNKAKNVLCGWVDLHNKGYDVFLWEISRCGSADLNEDELMKLYLPTNE